VAQCECSLLWRALQRLWVGANGAEERLPTLKSCAARIACIFHANRAGLPFLFGFTSDLFCSHHHKQAVPVWSPVRDANLDESDKNDKVVQ